MILCFVSVKSSPCLFRECGENEPMLSMARKTRQNFFFSSNHLYSLVFRFVHGEMNAVHSYFLQSASQLCLSLSTRWLPDARRTTNSGIGLLTLEFNSHLFARCWIDWTVCRESLPSILLSMMITFDDIGGLYPILVRCISFCCWSIFRSIERTFFFKTSVKISLPRHHHRSSPPQRSQVTSIRPRRSPRVPRLPYRLRSDFRRPEEAYSQWSIFRTWRISGRNSRNLFSICPHLISSNSSSEFTRSHLDCPGNKLVGCDSFRCAWCSSFIPISRIISLPSQYSPWPHRHRTIARRCSLPCSTMKSSPQSVHLNRSPVIPDEYLHCSSFSGEWRR